MIPLIVIAVYMKAIFNLQGAGHTPGVPSCFDENTILKTITTMKMLSIREVKLGTQLSGWIYYYR